MSQRMNNNRNGARKTATNVKPFCGHCKKIGLSEREYTSHWTRASIAPGAPVTCPSILNNQCNYCHEFGHFASVEHCPVLKLQKKEDDKRARAERPTKPEKSKAVTKQRNTAFSLLQEDSSDSEDDGYDSAKDELFFAKPVESRPQIPSTPSYASILKREPVQKSELEEVVSNFKVLIKNVVKKQKTLPKKLVVIDGVERLVYDWTADYDSDEDD